MKDGAGGMGWGGRGYKALCVQTTYIFPLLLAWARLRCMGLHGSRGSMGQGHERCFSPQWIFLRSRSGAITEHNWGCLIGFCDSSVEIAHQSRYNITVRLEVMFSSKANPIW
jgi:hypothetical protein